VGAGTAQIPELALVDRGEAAVETRLTYDGLRPVMLSVSKRGGRYKITDDGAAVAAAGASGWAVAYPDQIALGAYSVNVSRQGIVWLPAVAPSDDWLAKVCDLVSDGSVALYERLLESEDTT
jgi:hypothetical protein